MHTQIEYFRLRDIFNLRLLFFLLKTMTHSVSISCQSINDSSFVFIFVSRVITTALAVACLATEHLFLETLAIEFQASRFLAVTPHFLLFFHSVLFIVDMGYDYYITRTFWITSLRKLWWRISYCVWHWKAFLELFFERFTKGLRIHWILLTTLKISHQRVLPWTVILNGRWNETLIWAWAIEYFSKIRNPVECLRWSGGSGLQYFFDFHLVLIGVLHQKLLEQVVLLGILFIHHLRLMNGWQVHLFLHITIRLRNYTNYTQSLVFILHRP